MSQHNLAVRVCDILRNTKPMSAEQHASQSVDSSPPADSMQGPSPDANRSQFGGLKRKDTAVRLTHMLLEREFEAQQQRRGSVVAVSTKAAIMTKASTKSPPRTVTRKSAVAYAEELEALVSTCYCLYTAEIVRAQSACSFVVQANGSGKESHWHTLRQRLPDVLRLRLATVRPDITNRSGSFILSPKKSRRGFPAAQAALVQDEPQIHVVADEDAAKDDGQHPGHAADATLAMTRKLAERDRIAAARERAREKAMRAALREERETNSMINALHESSKVQTRRYVFAIRSLLFEVFWFVSLLVVFALFTPPAPDYNAPASGALVQSIISNLNVLVSPISDQPTWQAFVDYNLLWIQPGTTANGSLSTVNISSGRRLSSRTSVDSRSPQATLLFEPGDAQDATFAREHRYLRKDQPGLLSALVGWFTGARGGPETGSDAVDITSDVEFAGDVKFASDVKFSKRGRSLQNLSDVELPGGPVFLDGVPNATVWNDPATFAAAFQPASADPAQVAPIRLMGNLVVGSVRIRRTSSPVGPCSASPEVKGAPAQCRAQEPFKVNDAASAYVQTIGPVTPNVYLQNLPSDSGDVVVDLDSANLAQRRAAVDAHRANNPFVDDDTSSLSIDFSVYNPTLAVFTAVRIFTYFPPYGGASVFVAARTARIFESRFQPSATFEIVVAVLIALQLVQVYWAVVQANGLRSWIRSGWNIYEIVIVAMFVTVLALDVVNLAEANSLSIDLLKSGAFVDLWRMCGDIRNEIDVISALFYLLVIRGVRYARLIPGWGPVLMAIISTVTDVAVLQFLLVLLILIFAIGIAHFVAFAAESVYFGSLILSFENLFFMFFSQQFQVFTYSYPRVNTTIYFMVWSLAIVILQNLLIGIVGDVCKCDRERLHHGTTSSRHASLRITFSMLVTDADANKARPQSTEQWERHITQLMELSAVERSHTTTRRGLADWLCRLPSWSLTCCSGTPCVGCCPCLRDPEDSDDEGSPDQPNPLRRHGRVLPTRRPSDAAAPAARMSRWSVDARFLPRNMKLAGQLDETVQCGIVTASRGRGMGTSDGTNTNESEEMARRDPGVVLFEILHELSAELEAESSEARPSTGAVESAPSKMYGLRSRRRMSRNDNDSSGSGDEATTFGSSSDDSDDSGGAGDPAPSTARSQGEDTKRRTSRRRQIKHETRRKTPRAAPVGGEAPLGDGGVSPLAVPGLGESPQERQLAALVQASMSDAQVQVNRGIASLQSRLQQSESTASAALVRVEHVDSTLSELQGLMATTVTALLQQVAQQQAQTAALQQQLLQATALHQQLAADMARQRDQQQHQLHALHHPPLLLPQAHHVQHVVRPTISSRRRASVGVEGVMLDPRVTENTAAAAAEAAAETYATGTRMLDVPGRPLPSETSASAATIGESTAAALASPAVGLSSGQRRLSSVSVPRHFLGVGEHATSMRVPGPETLGQSWDPRSFAQ